MEIAQLTVILAEDDDGHAILVRRNLERMGIRENFIRVRDGQELLDLLSREVDGSLAGRPVLVLLDIAMPKIGGIEALRRLKSDPKTFVVPVYMLTTTDDPIEVSRCFKAGCNAYLTKPVSYQAFTAAIERLCSFVAVSQFPLSSPQIENACD